MKINKIIYDVREAIRQYTDDSEISDRYIIYLYNVKRAKYLRQDLNNLQKNNDLSVLQKICLELEEVSISECNVDLDCETIVRTKRPLPKLLESSIKPAIMSIKSTNRLAKSFNFITKERAAYSFNSPFKNSIFVFLDVDNYLYFISNLDFYKLIECITVTGIFDDPLELENYSDCCGCDNSPCFNYEESEYPLQSHHIDNIREEIVPMLVRKLQIPEDRNNNSNDE